MMVSLMLLVVSACGSTVKPRAINEKTDVCEVCNMAVMDNQFATQIVLENKQSLVFDDIGCMYRWINENKDEKIAGSFVRDYHDKEWIEREKAMYVYDEKIETPMSYHVVSFKNKKEAEDFAEKYDTKVLSFDDLHDHEWKMNKAHGDHKHSHEHKDKEEDSHSHK